MSLSLKIFLHIEGGTKFIGQRAFEEDTVTVGRSKSCTLSLEDPDRCLSRVHAEFVKKGQGYFMRVMSGTSPVMVNGAPHAQGSEVTLHPGDMLTMDVYEIEIIGVEPARPAPVAKPKAEPPAQAQLSVAARVQAANLAAPPEKAATPPAPPPTPPREAPRAAPAAAPVPAAAKGGATKWIVIGGVAVAGVVALALAWPMIKGVLPAGDEQKKAEQKIARLEGEARALLKLVEGDRKDIKDAVAAAKGEIEKLEGQVRVAKTTQERAPLEVALRAAERAAKLNAALEGKVREQAEGPAGIPKAEGNLSAATTATKANDSPEAVRLLEETVASLTQVRTQIAADRKATQAELDKGREELQAGAKAESEARTKAEIEARAKAEAEVKVRMEREARARAEADAARAAKAAAPAAAPAPAASPAPPPAAPMTRAQLAAQAAQEAAAAKAAKSAQAAQAAQEAAAARAAQEAAAAKAAQEAAAAKAAQEAAAAKAAQAAAAAKAAQEAQAAAAAASPCFGRLAGGWAHPVGGSITFSGTQATQVVPSPNYGSRAQLVTVMSISSCENDTLAYKVVRLALENTDDTAQAYDKTPANAPTLSTFTKAFTQRYSISASGMRFGNYTYAKR
jgi:hypothetical protein